MSNLRRSVSFDVLLSEVERGMHYLYNICVSPAGISATCVSASAGEALVLIALPEGKREYNLLCFFRLSLIGTYLLFK